MTTGTEQSAQILDAQVVGELRTLGDELLAEIIELFTADAPVRISRLEAAISAGSRDAILREAHGLKGSALGVGAARFARLCAEIENDARSGCVSEAASRSAHLLPEFKAVQAAFETHH